MIIGHVYGSGDIHGACEKALVPALVLILNGDLPYYEVL